MTWIGRADSGLSVAMTLPVDPVLGPGACHGGHQLSVASVVDLIFVVFSLIIVAATVSRFALP